MDTIKFGGCPFCGSQSCVAGQCQSKSKQEQSVSVGDPVAYRLAETEIYDFAGWLTTRKGVMKVGSSCEASPMAEAVGEYLKTFPERFAPQPRTWVGLTDEERTQLWAEWENGHVVEATEAKLKEKNNG